MGSSSDGAQMGYRFGNKNQWRRWVWNRIQERCKSRNGLVLYLAGNGAHDLNHAAARGFSPKNMIAVERDKKVIMALRSRGLLVIEGDLCDVLTDWPLDRPVDVVHADLCCGIEGPVLQTVAGLWSNPSFAKTAFAVNLQRGRDSSGNEFRASWGGVEKAMCTRLGLADKHRGVLMFLATAVVFCSLSDQGPMTNEQFAERLPVYADLVDPAFYSYKSIAGGVWFDTVVWHSAWDSLVKLYPWLDDVLRREKLRKPPGDLAQRRRTAAVLAHHARR